MKATIKQIKDIKAIYNEHGLNAVYGYCKRNNIDYIIREHRFGFQSSHKANHEKHEFLSAKTDKRIFRCHYYSLMKRAKNGWNCNLLRGLEFEFQKGF